MKNLWIIIAMLFSGLLLFTSCNNDTFCIKDYAYEAEAVDVFDLDITLPTGDQYSGGGVSHSFKMGEYDMIIDIVTVAVVDTETGGIFDLIHYIHDDKGNSFWSDDSVVLTNIGELGKATGEFNMNIVDGRGDFECADGQMTMTYLSDFVQEKVDFTLSGEMCGGCE